MSTIANYKSLECVQIIVMETSLNSCVFQYSNAPNSLKIFINLLGTPCLYKRDRGVSFHNSLKKLGS